MMLICPTRFTLSLKMALYKESAKVNSLNCRNGIIIEYPAISHTAAGNLRPQHMGNSDEIVILL